MNILIAGLVIFFAIHLVPIFKGVYSSCVNRLGQGAYKGLFALVSLVGFGLIVWGKGEAGFEHIWTPPQWGRYVAMVSVLVAVVLIMASQIPNNLKRYTRHPMLWGVFAWAVGHLLANGDKASLLLFGSFGVYALVAMMSLNRRGATLETVPKPVKNDCIVVASGVLVYALLLYFHGFLFGVKII